MGLPFLDGSARRKRDEVVAIDLGGRTTKAVLLQRKEETFLLNGYALLDAPIHEKSLSAELLAEHLKAASQALDAKGKVAAIAVGATDALMRHVEMPRMPVEDMRQVLKNNSRNYLQEDLANHVFDCFSVPLRSARASGEAAKTGAGPLKQRVLVAGAKAQFVQDYFAAIKAAGLVAGHIVPGLLGPVNTFEAARPEEFQRSVVAL